MPGVTDDRMPRDDQAREAGEAFEVEPSAPELKARAGHPEFLTPRSVPGSERSGCGRWGLLGCLAGVVVLAGVLVVSYQSMKGSVWDTAHRARERVEQRLPLELSDAERRRTKENLERFFDRLEVAEEPYPLMGGFVRRANDALVDAFLSPAEVRDINAYLESVIGTAVDAAPSGDRAQGPEAPAEP